MLEFEALGLDRVKVELAAQYVDHNLLQTDNKNADDHKFLQTAAARYGIHFSKPGNGVSHQVHMERFGVPGKTLLGADSHTPGAAGISMLGIGAGGLDVALAMAGYPYHLPCPKVLGVKLTGRAARLGERQGRDPRDAPPLRRQGLRGQDHRILRTGSENPFCHGPRDHRQHGHRDRGNDLDLSRPMSGRGSIWPPRAGATAWVPLAADEGAEYDEYAEIDLSKLEPLIAKPSSPGNVVPVREVAGIKVDQAIVGSSVNSSFRDLMVAAKMLEGQAAFIPTQSST